MSAAHPLLPAHQSAQQVVFVQRVPVELVDPQNQLQQQPPQHQQQNQLLSQASPPTPASFMPVFDPLHAAAIALPDVVATAHLETVDASSTFALCLTRPSDPFFLYSLRVRRDDFDSLKRAQNLLVSFDAFADMLKELLRGCCDCSASSDTPTSPSAPVSPATAVGVGPARFKARLHRDPSGAGATLAIVETNAFRHITHLALVLVPGNDAAVKGHLAALVKELKSETDSLRSKLATTETTLTAKLNAQSATSASLAADLDRMKIAYAEQASRMELDCNKRLTRDKEDHLRERENLRAGYERERRDLERDYEMKIRGLSNESTSLKSSNSAAQARIASLDSSLSATVASLDALKAEHSETQRDLATQRDAIARFRAQNNDLEAACSSLRSRVKELEELLAQKEANVMALEKRVFEETSRSRALLDEIGAERSKSSALDEGFRKATEEINKESVGNEIIRKIQTDLKSAKSKIKLKNVVTLQQEKLLDERASIIEMHEKDLAALKEASSTQTSECARHRAKIEELEKAVEEGKKIIAENGHVIEWLHKQLNEEALNKPFGGTRDYGRLDFDRFATSAGAASGPATFTGGYTNGNSAAISPSAGITQAGGKLNAFRDLNGAAQANNAFTGTSSSYNYSKHTGRGVMGSSPTRSSALKKTSPVREVSSLNTYGTNVAAAGAGAGETGAGGGGRWAAGPVTAMGGKENTHAGGGLGSGGAGIAAGGAGMAGNAAGRVPMVVEKKSSYF